MKKIILTRKQINNIIKIERAKILDKIDTKKMIFTEKEIYNITNAERHRIFNKAKFHYWSSLEKNKTIILGQLKYIIFSEL